MAEASSHDEKLKKKSKNKKHSRSDPNNSRSNNNNNIASSTSASATGKESSGTTTGGPAAVGDGVADGSCQHMAAYYKEFGLESFNVVHAFFSASISQDARRKKVKRFLNCNYHIMYVHRRIFIGSILSVLHLRFLRSSTVFLFALHLLRMQGGAHP